MNRDCPRDPALFQRPRDGEDDRCEASPDRLPRGRQLDTRQRPKGEMIFNTDWDDFPMLFFYDDTSNLYASGLDPTSAP